MSSRIQGKLISTVNSINNGQNKLNKRNDLLISMPDLSEDNQILKVNLFENYFLQNNSFLTLP